MGVEKSSADDILIDLKKYFKCSSKVKEPLISVGGVGSYVLEMASSPTVNDSKLLGSSEVEKALIRQWLEYSALYGFSINKSPSVAVQVLKELNGVLSRQTYLVKNNKTVADVILFYILWNVVSSLTFQEKESFLNLSRWFNTLQQEDRLRQSRKFIPFSRTLLY